MKYEICYLIGESNEANLEKVKDGVKKIIAEVGSLLPPEISEKRKMAYKVKKDVRGIYVAQQFEIKDPQTDADPASAGQTNAELNTASVDTKKDIISAISKKLNLEPDILRFMIIKAEEAPELKQRDIKEVRKIFETSKFVKPQRLEIKKPAIAKIKNEKEKKAEDENIDKKLDEILNI